MKKLFFGFFFIVVGSVSSTFALSCFEFLSFEQLGDDTSIVFEGKVTGLEYSPTESDSDSQYCSDLGSDLDTGVTTYTFELSKVYQGTGLVVGDMVSLTRQVTGIHCTRGGACNDMIHGERYVVVTHDGETLSDGLCNACPYKLADGYTYEREPDVEEPDMCICTMEYAPVCGVDGETYGNGCGAGCAGVEVDYVGECEDEVMPIVDPAQDPHCIVYNDGCNTCSKGPDGLTGCTEMACVTMGPSYCIEYIDDLPPIYDPSMDESCVSYYDGCNTCTKGPNGIAACTLRGCIDMQEAYCIQHEDDVSPTQTSIPNICISRYDGCNICTVDNGEVGACTKRACFQQDRAKCDTFTFTHLQDKHISVIEDVISTWAQTATVEDQERVLAKVSTKIDEINMTLATSSFVQGSKELRNLEFVLEILWAVDSVL